MGIAPVPVEFPSDGRKKPIISHWQKVGLQATEELITKFGDAPGIGFQCGQRSGIVEVDVDDPNHRALDFAISRFGQTPAVIRTASGNFKLWYRYDGEHGRIIKSIEEPPIDLLANGLTIAPPSVIYGLGAYEFLEGGVDLLADLPTIRPGSFPTSNAQTINGKNELKPVRGSRKKWLTQKLLRQVRYCDTKDDLIDVATTLNQDCTDLSGSHDPLVIDDVFQLVEWVWNKDVAGENWVGCEARVTNTATETIGYCDNPRLYWFRDFVRQNHAVRKGSFALDNEKLAEIIGWSRNTIRRVIDDYLKTGELERVHESTGPGDPHLYVLHVVKN